MIADVLFVFILGIRTSCNAFHSFTGPNEGPPGALPFMVYFPSYSRGICHGVLVHRMVVMTATVCVVDPHSPVFDTRPISVVVGTEYRHAIRGFRVQVTKLLIPFLTRDSMARNVMSENSVSLMLLKRNVPDYLVEFPLRALQMDYKGEIKIQFHDECLFAGWHYWFKGDKIYPPRNFLIQHMLRYHFMVIAQKRYFCELLELKFLKAMAQFGYAGDFIESSTICVRDGMYGAPMICKGVMVGMMTSPDAQWDNCTEMTNIIHLLNSSILRPFFDCVEGLFSPDMQADYKRISAFGREHILNDYDYVPALYDKVDADADDDY